MRSFQAMHFLYHFFGTKDKENIVRLLFMDPEDAINTFYLLKKMLIQIGKLPKDPTVDEMLHLKLSTQQSYEDMTNITETVRLDFTEHQFKTRAKEILKNLPVETIQSGVPNAHFSFKNHLQYFVAKNWKDDTNLQIKFSFDNSTVTNNHKRKMEIGTWKNVESTLYSTHSPQNCYIFWCAESDESTDLFLKEKSPNGIITQMNQFFKDPILGKSTVEPFLCADMAAAVKLANLKEVYRSNCLFRCLWCKVPRDKFSDFTIEDWPLRSLADQIKIGKTAMEKGEAIEGTIGPPILEIDWDHMIPCILHLQMAIGSKLISNLILRLLFPPSVTKSVSDLQTAQRKHLLDRVCKELTDEKEKLKAQELTKMELVFKLGDILQLKEIDRETTPIRDNRVTIERELESIFEKLGIKLHKPSKDSTFFKRWSKSRLNRNDIVHVLNNIDLFLNVAKKVIVLNIHCVRSTHRGWIYKIY
jgi:hypothetical protein